jgi:hypothetical protein
LTLRYSVTNHRVKLVVHGGLAESGKLKPGPGLVDVRWVEPAELGARAFSSAGRRVIRWIHGNLSHLSLPS